MREEYDFSGGVRGRHIGKRLRVVGAIDPRQAAIEEALRLIFQGIERLTDKFRNRKFTIDGRLVGDIGEVIAELYYDIDLDTVCLPNHDGTTSDKRRVQIKATFKDHLTFKTTPDYYLGFKLYPDGRYDEIFNGPGHLIYDHYVRRKDIGNRLLAFPASALRKLSQSVEPTQRIKKRAEMQKRGE
ncbi:MAG TPA: hypothetical protein DC054_16870 [Blastocatellia bacterium]|nr:hypothetical protein [Blastocatellia bacterium]